MDKRHLRQIHHNQRGCQDLSKAAVLLLHPHLHFALDQDLLPDLQNPFEMKTGHRGLDKEEKAFER